MKSTLIKPLLKIDQGDHCHVARFLPLSLYQPSNLSCSRLWYVWLCFLQLVIRTGIRLILRPRSGTVGDLNRGEVATVYEKEAKTYNLKHHLTTRGQDTNWRRIAGWCAVNFARQSKTKPLKVLDICTGTGLTVCEMKRIAAEWEIELEVTGVDYSDAMLARARAQVLAEGSFHVEFRRSDAMDLVGQPDQEYGDDLFRLQPNSIDLATQVFGIGGINEPQKVFAGVLEILKPHGQYLLIDMHQPIVSLPGEMPIAAFWCKTPLFESMTYKQTTIPLALNRLWAWRDTTLDYYVAQLMTYKQNKNTIWGFRPVWFNVVPERWWLGLPIMPTGRLLLQKEKINHREADLRRKCLDIVNRALMTQSH